MLILILEITTVNKNESQTSVCLWNCSSASTCDTRIVDSVVRI